MEEIQKNEKYDLNDIESKELRTTVSTLNMVRTEFCNLLDKSQKEIEGTLDELNNTILLVQSLPKNLSAELTEKTNELAKQINDLNQRNLKEFVESLLKETREHNEAIKDTIFQLNSVKDDVKNARLNQMRKYLKGLGITLLFSSIVAVASSYATIRFFPHKVNIDNPQKIEINNSDVGLWSSKNVQVKGDVKDYRR